MTGNTVLTPLAKIVKGTRFALLLETIQKWTKHINERNKTVFTNMSVHAELKTRVTQARHVGKEI